MRRTRLMFFALASALTLPLSAQTLASTDEAAIRTVLSSQAADWNRGDMDAYAKGYKDSPSILFLGKTVRRGYAEMIASYRKNYPNRAAMGSLTFTNLEVHLLDAHFAAAIGNFHLERSAAGGGNAVGLFSLVLEKTPAGWKIILDHSSSLSPPQIPPAPPKP
jgi:ketosteroid isomerase-like protein